LPAGQVLPDALTEPPAGLARLLLAFLDERFSGKCCSAESPQDGTVPQSPMPGSGIGLYFKLTIARPRFSAICGRLGRLKMIITGDRQ